eukprot:7088770-Ditylum_brightwellii.AAC.1
MLTEQACIDQPPSSLLQVEFLEGLQDSPWILQPMGKQTAMKSTQIMPKRFLQQIWLYQQISPYFRNYDKTMRSRKLSQSIPSKANRINVQFIL